MEESEDEEVLALVNNTRGETFPVERYVDAQEQAPAATRKPAASEPSTPSSFYPLPRKSEKPWQRSPVVTRRKTVSKPRKPTKIAVLKTVTNADDTVTVISRPLTCEECARHKEVVGMMPRKGPFQPYWDNLMLQASVYKLELRDAWQIALLTIPEELKSKLPDELRSGVIMRKVDEDELDNEVLDRLKAALLRLRGPTHASWHKILDIKQAPKEAFEVYAEHMWASFKEHSGIEEANRDQEVLLQLLKNNAGPHIQQALVNGADPPENTYRSLVEWASKIEGRINKQYKPRSISATQWVAEGKGVTNPIESGSSSQLNCLYCKKQYHRLDQCFRLREKLGLPRQASKNDMRIVQELEKFIRQSDPTASNRSIVGHNPKSTTNPFSELRASLAALAANYEDSQ